MYIPINDIENSIFFDIETVPKCDFSELNENELKLWKTIADKIRSKSLLDLNKSDEELWPQSCLYAEFGKIACISIGLYNSKKNLIYYRDYSSFDEKEIITKFSRTIADIYAKNNFIQLAGFFIEGFDIQYFIKRCLINRLEVPIIFNNYGKKPWEIKILDISKVWMGMGFQDRYMIKLDLLCLILDVKTPKGEIWGGNVWSYYKEQKIEEIGKYCNLDVIATIECALRISGIEIENIEKLKI